MVEFALVFPVLLAILVGTITAGMAYNLNNSLNNGARESTRYGATLPVDGDMSGWLNSVADVARDSASGDLHAGVPGQQICVSYVHPDGTAGDDRTTSLTEVAGVRTITVGSSCFTDSRPNDERRVQVALQRTTDLEAVVYSTTLTIAAESVARFERETD
jgi:Flp pilus assembly protein TadG